MAIKTQEELIQEYVDSKIKNKELFLPEYIIPKIDAYIELVLAIRNRIYKTTKSSESKLKNSFLINCALYYTSFYYKYTNKNIGGYLFTNEKRLQKIVGDSEILPSIKYLLTDFYDEANPDNSNSRNADLYYENENAEKGETKNGAYWLLALHLYDMIPAKHQKNVSRENVYAIVEDEIKKGNDIFSHFLECLDIECCIVIDKPVTKGGGDIWNKTYYRILPDVFNNDHLLITEKGELEQRTINRFTKIYGLDSEIYSIGDPVCYWDYKTSMIMDYNIDYEIILDGLLSTLKPYTNKKTKKIITPQMQVESYKRAYLQIVKSIPNGMNYKRTITLDRHYNPYQRIKSILRKQINEHNDFIEVDYKSAQLNVLIAIAVGDVSDDVLKNNLFPETYNAVIKARKKARLKEKDKNELREYYGDFYQNILDRFTIPYTRDVLKADTVTFLNIQSNKMKHFKSLIDTFKLTDALDRLRFFIEVLKFDNNKDAYQVLFKIESILIRDTIIKCIKKKIPTICIHDAICCPKKYKNTVKSLMNKSAIKYNVLTYAEIESNNKYLLDNSIEDKLIDLDINN